jgi:hypothetical protein
MLTATYLNPTELPIELENTFTSYEFAYLFM